MRVLLLCLAALSAGCVSSAIKKTDDMAERRIRQLEDSVARQLAATQEALSKVKSDAISEAKSAAGDLVSQASGEIKASGNEIVDHAADRVGKLLEEASVRLDTSVDKAVTKALDGAGKRVEAVVAQASRESQKIIKKAVDDANKAIGEQREAAVKDLQKTLREDVPKAVGDSVVGAADKVMERLGVSKKTGTDESGNPMTWWVLGGGGLVGTLFTFGKTAWRMWTAKKRDDEDDEWLEEKLAEKMKARKDGAHVVHPCSCGAPAPASPPQG